MSQLLTHKNLITQWFDRSQSTASFAPSLVDRFVYLWFAFNAWASYSANTYVDKNMIDWFAKNKEAKSGYQSLLDSDLEFRSRVTRLASYEVLDMRSPETKGMELDNVHDFEQLIKIIYQIRCNLFHGKKSLDDPHDIELVGLAYDVLTAIFKQFIGRLRENR